MNSSDYGKAVDYNTVEFTSVTGAIRRFADSGIQAAVNRVVNDLPAGKTGAVVAVADSDGARLATVAKLGEHWSVVGVLEKPWGGKLEGQAAVTFSW